jgi:hypothetical protein
MLPGKTTLQPGFEVVCSVSADLTECSKGFPVLKSHTGQDYRNIKVCVVVCVVLSAVAVLTNATLPKHNICIALGETEITARMSWRENVSFHSPIQIQAILITTQGAIKYGPATIAYE